MANEFFFTFIQYRIYVIIDETYLPHVTFDDNHFTGRSALRRSMSNVLSWVLFFPSERYHKFISYCLLDLEKQTPHEICRLGPKAVSLYQKALTSGSYNNNLIRCMVVGHYGVGKTTLVNGLLGKKRNFKTKSTDGIDIHLAKCFYNKSTRTWHIEGNFLNIDILKEGFLTLQH